MSLGYGLGLGRVFNVVHNASGVNINLTHYGAVTFVSFEDDGSTILTLTECQDAADTGEQALAIIDKVHKGPGVGGTWTEVTQTAAGTYDLADDTTNDAVCLTVEAGELSDGFTHVQCTVDGGVVTAILHDPKVRRKPANMPSPIA